MLLGWGELDPMMHRKGGFGELAGGVGVRICSKRLKPNPDTPLGRHNSLRYRTVGANAIIPLFEANRSNPGTQLTNIRNFGNTNHTHSDWMHSVWRARRLLRYCVDRCDSKQVRRCIEVASDEGNATMTVSRLSLCAQKVRGHSDDSLL